MNKKLTLRAPVSFGKRKIMKWHEEAITKDKLLSCIKRFNTVEVILLKDGEPVYILKNRSWGLEAADYDRDFQGAGSIVIHKGKFIWSNSVKVTAIKYVDDEITKVIIGGYKKGDNYEDKYKGRYSSREFSIKSILDGEVKIYGIKPVRAFFRQYGILEEYRGKVKGTDKTTEILNQFLKDEYTKHSRKEPFPVSHLRLKLIDRVNVLFPKDEKQIKKYSWSYATIRRRLENLGKK